LAVSSSDVLFAYNSEGSGHVKRYNNGAWEQVGTANFAGGAMYAKMVVGSDNYIYVSQVSGGLKVYRISVNASSTDTWALVGGANVASAYSSDSSLTDLSLDNNNVLYFSYLSPSSNGRKLNVKKFDGTNWVQVGNADFTDAGVNYTAVTVAQNGAVYAAASVWDSSNSNHTKNSVYALNSGFSTWAKIGGDVISDGAATFNDLAIDSSGKLVLAYSQGGLRVKRLENAALLSVKDVKKSNIELYPNPVIDYVYVKGNGKITCAEVYNTAGQIIKPAFDAEKINLSELQKGNYILKIKLNNESEYTQKILKK